MVKRSSNLKIKKNYLHLLYQKNLLQKFNLATKIIFTCFFLEMNEFLQFYLQNYFNLFSFKKSDLYKLFNIYIYITLFAKELKKKRKDFYSFI